MTSERNRSSYIYKSIRESYYIYGIVEYILPVIQTFIKKKSVANRSIAYRMTINNNNNNHKDTTITDTNGYESVNNEGTIDILTTEIDRLSQELAALQLAVKHLRNNRNNTGTYIKRKKRRSGDIRVGDGVRVLSNHKGRRGLTGKFIATSSAQATIQTEDPNQQTFRVYKVNLKVVDIDDE